MGEHDKVMNSEDMDFDNYFGGLPGRRIDISWAPHPHEERKTFSPLPNNMHFHFVWQCVESGLYLDNQPARWINFDRESA
jgi:hypothetical protein